MAELQLTNGGRINYVVTGSGPPLLLVPGLGGRGDFWQPLVPRFADRFTVVLHDHRGTGRSSLDRLDYSVEQMASDLLALMDHLGLERAHLVGHSTGGAIGQTLAIDRPERIDRLVLSATWPAPDAYFRQLFSSRAEVLRRAGPGAYLRLGALFLHAPWWLRDNPHISEISDAQAAAEIPDPKIVLSRIAAILRFNRSADLHRIAAPTLVIGARDDAVTPIHFSEELNRLIRGAETTILQDGGHFFPIIHADKFCERVTEFLTRDNPRQKP